MAAANVTLANRDSFQLRVREGKRCDQSAYRAVAIQMESRGAPLRRLVYPSVARAVRQSVASRCGHAPQSSLG
eukprot:scaffold227098_cov18-Prasinocladus_malaysianus.AAC.2